MHLSTRQIGLLVTRGSLHAVRRGVYRTAGVAPSWEQCVRAALLVAPAGAVTSHRSAARLWRFAGVDSDLVEITTLHQARLSEVVLHLTRHLPPSDWTGIGGLAVTSVARTLCDLSTILPPAVLARALDDALRREVVTLAAVRQCAERLRSPGGRQLRPILDLIAARTAGPALGDSPLEGKVLRWLRQAGEPEPTLQLRVHIGGRTYRPDLSYPELRIAIELLGWEEHGKRSTFDHDRSRSNDFGIAGWLTLEFTDQHQRDEVINRVRAARLTQLTRLGQLSAATYLDEAAH
jgi:hypothetical protein